MSKPASSARLAASTQWPLRVTRSATESCRGTIKPSAIGSAVGATMSQVFSPRARSSAVSGPLPNQGRCMEPLRPECAIWMPGTTPCAFMKAAMRCERRDVRRRPDAEVAVGDAALVGHGGGLDEHARGAPQHQPAPMREMKILGDAVHRRVGGHRGDDDAVLERHLADGDGREEERLGHRRMRARGVRRAGSGAQQVRAGAVKSLAAGAH